MSEHALPLTGTRVVAVLTAAGSGSRLGSVAPKALVELAGESLLRRAARGLLASAAVGLVVVTAPAENLEECRCQVQDLGPVTVVAGSPASRQASVALGLDEALRLAPDAQVVLVHDAARALTPPAMVRRVVQAVLSGHDAVVPALPVTDTVKEVQPAEEGVERVVGTPQRSRLRAVQTPQGFRTPVLVQAHRQGEGRALDESAAASDDAELVEAAGGEVHVVAGDSLALKVTTPLDLAVARYLVAQGS